MSFVGYKNISSVELKELLTQNANSNSYYFLRWVDKVSGIVEELPSTFEQSPSPEGQMFNSRLELRWEKKGSGFEVLLLSNGDSLPEFSAIKENEKELKWETEVRDAYLYQPTVTRFPNRFKYPNNLKIAQRYFKNKKTSTVHFIALTVQEKQ